MTDRRIVLDLETKRTFDEVGGRNQLDKLGVSVVGVYDYNTDEYICYEEKDFGKLQNRLIDASLIIGFNHIYFDMPVLQPYLSVDVKNLPCFDIMLDIQERLGFRISLDSVATATLGKGKIGTGLDAIKYFNEGRWQELKDYCLMDVKVTKEVLDFGIKNKKIHYKPKFGHTHRELKVNWSSHNKNQANSIVETAKNEPAQYKLF